MAERKPISKRQRWQILERDGFKCRYCGRGSDEVRLEIDHMKPVVGGGCNCMSNLVTACFDCNRGKGISVLGSRDEEWFLTAVKKAREFEKLARIHFQDPQLHLWDFALLAECNGRISIDKWIESMWRVRVDDKDDFVWHIRCEIELYVEKMECPT